MREREWLTGKKFHNVKPALWDATDGVCKCTGRRISNRISRGSRRHAVRHCWSGANAQFLAGPCLRVVMSFTCECELDPGTLRPRGVSKVVDKWNVVQG